VAEILAKTVVFQKVIGSAVKITYVLGTVKPAKEALRTTQRERKR
jgi:hypothetical protein